MDDSWRETLRRIDEDSLVRSRRRAGPLGCGTTTWARSSPEDEIKELTRALTYSEMMEWNAGLWQVVKESGCDGINKLSWPSVLIQWAHNRQGRQ